MREIRPLSWIATTLSVVLIFTAVHVLLAVIMSANLIILCRNWYEEGRAVENNKDSEE